MAYLFRRIRLSVGAGGIAICGLFLSLIGVFAVAPAVEQTRESLRSRGRLEVFTLNSPTTYYETRDGEYAGLEYALTQSFAEWAGMEAEYRVFGTVSELLEALRHSPGAIGAAGLSPTRDRRRHFDFGPVYQTIEQQVVCHRRVDLPRDLAGLQGLDIAVTAASSYLDSLRRLRRRFPSIRWTVREGISTEQLLEQVWKRKVQCAVADSNIVGIHRRYFPELEVPLALGDSTPLAWALPRGDRVLRRGVQIWLNRMRRAGQLTALRYRYYGYLGEFDYYDTRVFRRRVRDRLPRYEALLRRAARRYQFPWTLLAAMAYQESHWDPRAESATGVKGIMMLTRNTAEALGVKDRENPEESVMGGARYLRRMERRLPKSVRGINRLWQALAAYNVGMGHLKDARRLARKLGRDPDRWSELREVLPLLSKREYYRELPHGYARGFEPVRYVQRIRNYRDLIENLRRETRRPSSKN